MRLAAARRAAEVFLWCAGAVLLGCYAWVYLDRGVYQAFQEWRFDRELEHRSAPLLGFVMHSLEHPLPNPSQDSGNSFSHPSAPAAESLPTGALIGRIEIPNVGVRAMIVNGTTPACLRRAVGHIEGTPLFGSEGNVGLAGHRDTFFRGLREVRPGDTIEIKTLHGNYEYVVETTRIVGPSDTEVLDATVLPRLTLVTCYPFRYVGAAPQRFVVQARAANSSDRSRRQALQFRR